MILQGKAKHPVAEVMLHTSATPTNWHVGKTAQMAVDEIDGWHKARGWAGIGYHRVFMPSGSMGVGRSISRIGAGCKGRNRGVIHLCLVPVGGIQTMGEFSDFYTDAQQRAVSGYIQEVRDLVDGPLIVTGHNEFANKLCPGFRVLSHQWGGDRRA